MLRQIKQMKNGTARVQFDELVDPRTGEATRDRDDMAEIIQREMTERQGKRKAEPGAGDELQYNFRKHTHRYALLLNTLCWEFR